MRVLLANLKHLYQRRHLWPVYLILGLLLLIPILNWHDREAFAMIWHGSLLVGVFMGVTSKEVIDKPFVRCLPGHLQALRRMIFLVALSVGLPAGVLFTCHSGAVIWRSPTLFCASVALSTALYLAGIELMLLSWPVGNSSVGMLFSLATTAAVVAGTYCSARFEPLLLRYPTWVLAGAIAVNLIVWLQMGRRQSGWRIVGQGRSFGNSDRQRALYRAFERRLSARARAMAITESLFLGRMKRSSQYSGRRYVWGTLYVGFGLWAASWKWLIYAFVVVAIVSGYLDWTAVVVFAGIAWMADQRPSWPPLHSSLLVPAGRWERFLATMSLAAATAGIIVLWIAVVAITSVPLSRVIPELKLWGMPLVYLRISMWNACIPLVVVPLHAVTRMIAPRRWWFLIDLASMVAVPIVLLAAFIVLIVASPISPTTIATTAPAWIVGTMISAWVLFLTACRYRTRYGALGNQ